MGGARGRATPPRRIDGWLGWFAAGTLGLTAACFALGTLLVRGGAEAAPETVLLAVGELKIEVPGRWLRARSGAWASLAVPASEIGLAELDGSLLVHLTPGEGAMDPADRPTQLCARFLSPEAEAAGGDLVRRAFRPGTPYEGETLYLAPPDGRAFAARCTGTAVGPQAECSAAFRVRGVEVGVGLPASALPHGPALVARLAARLSGR